MLLLNDIAHFLSEQLTVDRYAPDEQGGTYLPSNRPISVLGLALEPWPGLVRWLSDNHVDAVWLHRPWKLNKQHWPSNVGVLYHHLPFDEHLTIGYNQYLAESLGLKNLEPIGFKQHPERPLRPIGMLADVSEQSFADWVKRIKQEFQGYDQVMEGNAGLINCLAVVGAMNNTLVYEAAECGASLYITGQYRPSAQKAVDETGMAVVAVGHQRSEVWGLKHLAEIIQQQWPALTVLTGP